MSGLWGRRRAEPRRDAGRRPGRAPVSRVRELAHDASLYEAYRAEEARSRQEHEGAEIRRVVLDGDLKREYQSFLQDRNRDRPDSDGRPDRDAEEIVRWRRRTTCRTSTTPSTFRTSASTTRSTVARGTRTSSC